ncbi:hypothetical protein IVB18_47745 [Bradyrhizobium sp. 186]|uniref:hypothetical protein n=1 Tax=Bradyrhizobium sp. 186 TaxID=2782654 RepID=UPI002000FCD7|nr:hypothetical protein [Bradyrhizobium sp. 186]UPK35553.1 hypothetical protein IVB18_47745 [Bradyrhizobium sp. 186]
MDMRKYASEHFLKLDDVREGPLTLRIALVRDGSYDKPDVVFESGEVLSLNATNLRTLIRAFGPDSDDWIGKDVEAALGPVMFQGKPQDGVIVTPISATEPRAEPGTKRNGDMGDSIPF